MVTTVLLVLETMLLALGVVFVGLLRSHTEILRRLRFLIDG